MTGFLMVVVFVAVWAAVIYFGGKKGASLGVRIIGGGLIGILAMIPAALVLPVGSQPEEAPAATAAPAAPRDATAWCQYNAFRNKIYDEVARKWNAAHPNRVNITDADDKKMARQREPKLRAERKRLFGNISDKDFQLLNARAIEGRWYQRYCVAKRPEETWVPVTNSAWDGSVRQVEIWIKKNLNDADSFQAAGWTHVVKIKDGYIVWCKFRAKNEYGAYMLHRTKFILDRKGNVIDVSGDLSGFTGPAARPHRHPDELPAAGIPGGLR